MKDPKILQKPNAFYATFDRKKSEDRVNTHYCPGCGHGRLHKYIAEAIDDLNIGDRTILINPVGCSVFAYYYFDCGNIGAPHGRAPAVATGAKRSHPGSIVISYQGDGDLAGIGTAEIIHAANRGEHITVFFINNAIYGMTGGQMAPTSLLGQKTITSPRGRDSHNEGYPIRMAEMIATMNAPVYVERVALTNAKEMMKARRAVRKALQCQIDGKGFSFVEVLSACPTGFRMDPNTAISFVENEMMANFPVQVFKDDINTRESFYLKQSEPSDDDMFKILRIETSDDKQLASKPEFKDQHIRIAGFGGQGVMMAGTTIATLGMEEGLHVTWLPSYGPEMRGGTANCHVTISKDPIGSPLVTNPNVLIAMNGPSYDEFENTVVPGGVIMVNSSMIDREPKRIDVTTLKIPFTEIANKAGLKAAANMVAVASYLAYTNVISITRLIDLIPRGLKKKNLIDQNIELVKLGVDYVETNYH